MTKLKDCCTFRGDMDNLLFSWDPVCRIMLPFLRLYTCDWHLAGDTFMFDHQCWYLASLLAVSFAHDRSAPG